MNAIDFIRMSLENGKGWTLGLIGDMKDAPLTQPTPNGGNHPIWVLGHLVRAESDLLTLSLHEDFEKEMTVRVYDLADLILRIPHFKNAKPIDVAEALTGGDHAACKNDRLGVGNIGKLHTDQPKSFAGPFDNLLRQLVAFVCMVKNIFACDLAIFFQSDG